MLNICAQMQLMLNGYTIITKESSGLAKVCSVQDDTTWLPTALHAIEAYYSHVSKTATPIFNISYSGADSGGNEVCLVICMYTSFANSISVCWVKRVQSENACKIMSQRFIDTYRHKHTHIPRFLCRRAQQANAGQYLGSKRPLQSQTYPCRLALVWRLASLLMLKSAQ